MAHENGIYSSWHQPDLFLGTSIYIYIHIHVRTKNIPNCWAQNVLHPVLCFFGSRKEWWLKNRLSFLARKPKYLLGFLLPDSLREVSDSNQCERGQLGNIVGVQAGGPCR